MIEKPRAAAGYRIKFYLDLHRGLRMLKRKPLFALTFALLNAWALGLNGCAAADSSMDTLWNEQPAGSKSHDNVSAPLCTIDAFKQSDLIQSGAWLGVGPFHGDNNELVDASQNKISVSLDQDRIIGAKFSVCDKPTDMLKLQISADFLLESLGAKPAKIADFNTQLDGASSQLATSSNNNPVNLSAGRYLVYIFPEKNGADNNYVIRVNSKDVDMEALRGGSRTAENPGRNHNVPVPTKVTVTTGSAVPVDVASATTIHPVKPAVETPAATEDLKSAFTDLINNWQQVKCVAVKDKDATALPNILSGKALSTQTGAVKWLTDHKRHYENSPKTIVIDHYTELAKGQKYVVTAEVSETSKYIDEATGQVLKDTSDSYGVDYTVEKIGGKWYITDSAKVTAAAPKTQSNASR
jgi:hypothetical protein